MPPIILASTSSIRAKMLREAGIAFDVIASPCDEEALKSTLHSLSPPERALTLAKAKAKAVSILYPEKLVIGADQICALSAEIFSKPENKENAIAQLSRLAGNTHQQHSAACIMHGETCLWEGVETAHLTMYPLSMAEIEAYVARDNPLTASGSYYFEAHGHQLFSHVDGSSCVIQGLPSALYSQLTLCAKKLS